MNSKAKIRTRLRWRRRGYSRKSLIGGLLIVGAVLIASYFWLPLNWHSQQVWAQTGGTSTVVRAADAFSNSQLAAPIQAAPELLLTAPQPAAAANQNWASGNPYGYSQVTATNWPVASTYAQLAGVSRHEGDGLSPELRSVLQALRKQPKDVRNESQLKQLRDALEKQFQARHDNQIARLKQIMEEANQANAVLERRLAQKDEIVQRRLNELLGQSDPTQWEYSPSIGEAPQPATAQPRGAAGFNPFGVYPQGQPVPGGLPRLPTAPIGPREPNDAPASPTPATPAYGTASAGSPWQSVQPARTAEPRLADSSVSSQSFRAAPTDLAFQFEPPAAESLVATGYRWRGLSQELPRWQQQYEKGVRTLSELEEKKNALEAAKAQWQFDKRKLQHDLAIAQLELETALNALEQARRIDKSMGTSDSEQKAKQAELNLRAAELKLSHLDEQLQWARDFEKRGDFDKQGDSEEQGDLEEQGETASEPTEVQEQESVEAS